ncbi:MAG: thiolase family protein [Acidimicrobiales bacterium]
MREVLVAGAAMTPFGKFLERNIRSLVTEATGGALADAGLAPSEVGFVVFGNAAAGVLTGQEMIRAQVALADSGLAGLPMVNVENACASASSAFNLAWMAVASGQAEVALAIGAEKMTHTDKNRANVALARAVDVEQLVADLGEEVLEQGAGALFMEIYAKAAEGYMAKAGCGPEAFAAAAAVSHFHGSLNPKAQYRTPRTMEEVLASRPIAGPLTLLMCSPIGDGSAALVLTSDEYAARHGLSGPKVRGTAIRSGTFGEHNTVVERCAEAAFQMAGVGPADIDVIELHDAAAPAQLQILEELGVAGPGEAVKLVMDGDTRLGGSIPVNPSGGLIAKGHPVGATGCAQLVELVDQLRGRAGDRQVPGARWALAENAGGDLGAGPAACVVTILEAE